MDKVEKNNHENTKYERHEIFFRVFALSCFRDKEVLIEPLIIEFNDVKILFLEHNI
jgi:hypothetical protein